MITDLGPNLHRVVSGPTMIFITAAAIFMVETNIHLLHLVPLVLLSMSIGFLRCFLFLIITRYSIFIIVYLES